VKYLILGGGGSFGLHTARYLLEKDQLNQVWAVGRSEPKSFPFHDAILGGITPRFKYIRGHVTYDHDFLALEVINFIQPDVIVNFAAQGEGATSFTESWRYFETNCVGLSRLVEALVGLPWLKRFIHIGSSEVYGSNEVPVDERAPLRPTSPYAISKAAFDQYLLAVSARRKFPGIVVRPSNCYGEGQQLHRLVPKAMLFGMTGRKLPLHGGGTARKSYIHSEDLARAISVIAEWGTNGEVYNVGPQAPTSIVSVAYVVAATLGMATENLVNLVPDRDHQDSVYWLNSDKVRKLGWTPIVGWDNGMRRMKAWVENNLDALCDMPTDFVMRP